VTARKSTGKSTATGKPFTKGDARRAQPKGPKKGATNAGRPPDAFKAEMQAMGSRADVLAKVKTVLSDPDHPDWARMVALVWDRGYGKPSQAVDVTSGGDALTSFTLGIGTGTG
jgi:hypothetical protein